MVKKIPWYRWPENPRTGRVAWYTIARRLIFWPIMMTGFLLTTLGLWLAYGNNAAYRFFKDGL